MKRLAALVSTALLCSCSAPVFGPIPPAPAARPLDVAQQEALGQMAPPPSNQVVSAVSSGAAGVAPAAVAPPSRTHSMIVRWGPVTNATGYRVQYGRSPDKMTNSVTTPATNSSATISGLPIAPEYFAVRTQAQPLGLTIESDASAVVPSTNIDTITWFVDRASNLAGPWTNIWSLRVTNNGAPMDVLRLRAFRQQ